MSARSTIPPIETMRVRPPNHGKTAEMAKWNALLKSEGLGVIRPSERTVGNPDRYTASQKPPAGRKNRSRRR